jgi:HEAT repeat protein
VSRKPATVAAASAEEAKSTGELVSRLVVMLAKPESDAAKRASSRRALAFDLLAARDAVLVADGVSSIAEQSDLATTLTADEQKRMEEALARGDLPVKVRLALIRMIGDKGLTQLVPALQRLTAPEIVGAAWEALSKLENAPSRESIEEKLASPEPRVRSAAVQQLLRQEKAAAAPQAIKIATSDPDLGVRVAATEAFGEIAPADAVPALETIYRQPTWETRQAVARTLRQFPGRTAVEAFERMAFTAPADGQRYAVVLLRLSVDNLQDELLQRVIKTHPDPEVRKLAEQGIEAGHH